MNIKLNKQVKGLEKIEEYMVTRQGVNAIEIIRGFTNNTLLFHSVTGKDSILLLDLLFNAGFKVQPVYMFTVPELEYVEKYINYFENQYSVKFIRVPHYVLLQRQKKSYNLSKLIINIKERTGIKYCAIGFKIADSMHRNLMLKPLAKNNYIDTTFNYYPLAELKNKEILSLIKQKNLLEPKSFGNSRSMGENPNDIEWLNYLKDYWPNDFYKTLNLFPESRIILKRNEIISNQSN